MLLSCLIEPSVGRGVVATDCADELEKCRAICADREEILEVVFGDKVGCLVAAANIEVEVGRVMGLDLQ